LRRVIPVAATFFAPPVETILMARERSAGKDQYEAVLGIRNVGDHPIDHGVGTRDKWFLNRADARVVKRIQVRLVKACHDPAGSWGEFAVVIAQKNREWWTKDRHGSIPIALSPRISTIPTSKPVAWIVAGGGDGCRNFAGTIACRFGGDRRHSLPN
jgi:hypothetical protein